MDKQKCKGPAKTCVYLLFDFTNPRWSYLTGICLETFDIHVRKYFFETKFQALFITFIAKS